VSGFLTSINLVPTEGGVGLCFLSGTCSSFLSLSTLIEVTTYVGFLLTLNSAKYCQIKLVSIFNS
jgi:hypothetical protein